MPRADSLTLLPQDISYTTALIHRLRHPLRKKRAQHPSSQSTHAPAARTGPDQRRPNEDLQAQSRLSRNSLHKLLEIKDKGDYTEQRYGDVDLYWNSVMVEASEQEKAQRATDGALTTKGRSNGRGFADTEQLYKAYHNRRVNQKSDPEWRQQASSLIAAQTTARTVQSNHTSSSSRVPLVLDQTLNADRSAPSASGSTSAASETRTPTNKTLTWNAALTTILAGSAIDPALSTAIRARARNHRSSSDTEEVDMRKVALVPNFSYPLPSARWVTAWYNFDGGLETERECVGLRVGGDKGKLRSTDFAAGRL